MRALRVVELIGPDGVRVADVPEPPPSDADLLVDVRAVGIGFPDLLKTRGEYQIRQEVPYTLGTECAGIVLRAESTTGLRMGDRVAGFAIGAATERVLLDPHRALRLPDDLSFEQGAALPLNYGTAIVALALRGRIRSGEVVLVHGAAGGTGSAALQVAKAFGCRVLAVVSTDEKAEIAKSAGADLVLRSDRNWKDDALRATEGRGVDIVFDPVAGDRWLDTTRALALGGRWIVIGFVGGAIPHVPLNRLLLRNIDVIGSYYEGVMSSDPSIPGKVKALLTESMESGLIKPVVGPVHRLEDGAAALRSLAERRAIGKVVLTVP